MFPSLSISSLSPSQSKTRPLVSRNFYCPHCDKSFRDNYNLNIHMNVHRKAQEGKIPLIQCPHCEKLLRSQGAFRNHIKIHNGEQRFEEFPPLMEEDAQLSDAAESSQHQSWFSSSEGEDGGLYGGEIQCQDPRVPPVQNVFRGLGSKDRNGLSPGAEVRCYICEITMGSISFFTHMQWHSQTIADRCLETRERLKLYMKTLEQADTVLKEIAWTVR